MATLSKLGAAVLIAVLAAYSPCSAETARTEIRGAALGMTLSEAMNALTRQGAICGKGLFDSHRCDFDSDTWIHLHVVGPDKIVQSIRYVYPALRDPDRFASFRSKVVAKYSLNPVDNRTRYVTPHGAAFTITDGQIDLEVDGRPEPAPVSEPAL